MAKLTSVALALALVAAAGLALASASAGAHAKGLRSARALQVAATPLTQAFGMGPVATVTQGLTNFKNAFGLTTSCATVSIAGTTLTAPISNADKLAYAQTCAQSGCSSGCPVQDGWTCGVYVSVVPGPAGVVTDTLYCFEDPKPTAAPTTAAPTTAAPTTAATVPATPLTQAFGIGPVATLSTGLTNFKNAFGLSTNCAIFSISGQPITAPITDADKLAYAQSCAQAGCTNGCPAQAGWTCGVYVSVVPGPTGVVGDTVYCYEDVKA